MKIRNWKKFRARRVNFICDLLDSLRLVTVPHTPIHDHQPEHVCKASLLRLRAEDNRETSLSDLTIFSAGDDLMSATRYAVMILRRASTRPPGGFIIFAA